MSLEPSQRSVKYAFKILLIILDTRNEALGILSTVDKVVLQTWNFVYIYLFRQTRVRFPLRWLDTVFQGQYLPSLSVNYVAINKVLKKWPPQLY